MVEIKLNNLNANVILLDKHYRALKDFFLIQIKFQMFYDYRELRYNFSAIIREPDLESATFSIECIYSKHHRPVEFIDHNQLLEEYGLIRVFGWFKEEIFCMVETELERQDYAHFRFFFLPI